MKRIALAPLLLAALTFAPAASADHGHNCVWSGGAWIGQGLCPGMPGFVPHTATPTAEPSPTTTQAPAPTTPTVTPSPTSTAPSPTSTAPAPTATSTSTPQPTAITPRPTSTPTTVCVWSGGAFIGQGDPRDCPRPALPRATPSTSTTSTTTPAPVATGPLVETDIVLYAPEVNPARILR